MISQDYLVGLTKQVFMLDYVINGLFPCQSDVVTLIRSNKREWKFNDKFEYRMLLSHTNTGGTLNSQVFKENVALHKPGSIEYGIYRATYGSVSDGISVDMVAQLETKDKTAAFEDKFTIDMQSLRFNVSSLFKNFAIHGQYGVVHQIRDIDAPVISADRNPVPNIGTRVLGVPFTIKVPINVFASNFKTGKLLIKTTEVAPWGAANVAELYLVLDNQPGLLSLLPVGTSVSPWVDGQFLEVQGNREVAANSTVFQSSNWTPNAITVAAGAFAGTYDQFMGNGAYTSGENAMVGAMEGLADMFPWYTNPATPETRLGLDMSYRDQANRLLHSVEQAGGWIVQRNGEHIIDVIQRGAFLTKITVPYAKVGIWINPATKQRMGYEEGGDVRVIRVNTIEGPIHYQRGVNSTTYQIGQQMVKEMIEDPNLPTDVIIVAPEKDLSYNCWDNSYLEIDKYILETWGKNPPPRPEDLQVPDEFIAKLDITDRVVFGQPTLSDGGMAAFQLGNRIRHPKNSMPIAYHEMGALFTEYPYSYSIIKLRNVETDFLGD